MNELTDTNTVEAWIVPTDKCRNLRHFSLFRRRGPGQSTVEFALICLPFFAIIFAIVDYAQIYFYENSLQNALRESARFATAGRIIQAVNSSGVPEIETNSSGYPVPKAISDSSGREASRDECIKYWFDSNCIIQLPASNISIVSATYQTGVEPNTSTNSAGKLILLDSNSLAATAGPGGANDYIQVTAQYNVSTITPLFTFLGGYSRSGWDTYPIIVTAIVKNEPALLNFEHLAIYGATNANGEQ